MMEYSTGNAVPGIFCNCCKVEFYHEDDSMEMAEEAVKKDLADKLIKVWNKRPEQPTAQERPVGHWKRCGVFAHCSNCLCSTIYPSDRDIDFEFCPHCGADMREDGAAE